MLTDPHDLLLLALFSVSLLIIVSSLDDAFIDILSVGIERARVFDPQSIGAGKDMIFAVFVANWHEENVLKRMVEGNLARIPRGDVRFYLGVYPNDSGTLRVALELADEHPSRVRVIVNSLNGPTSKGQMLNEMFRQVYSAPESPDLAILHDSEDVIDPRTFDIYRAYTRDADFVQVPVFSLNSVDRSLVAATYMDEFAERHTREMVVRDALGAAVPSAGVGTCMTRRLIEDFLRRRGTVLATGCVTEDYILGIEAKRAGFRARFAAVSANESVGLDYVATREFFPKTLTASVKQKTRWVYGIDFEATRKLGWSGDGWDLYFFLRDRKGALTNFLPPLSLALMLIYLLGGADDMFEPETPLAQAFAWTSALNLGFLVLRFAVRVRACQEVYGYYDPLGVAARWPVSLYINFLAVWRAWKTFLGESAYATKPIVWSKTAHEIPDNFMSAKR